MRKLLIVGCGDIAWRALPVLVERFRVYAVLRDSAKFARWRAAGAVPVLADLDRRESLRHLAGLAAYVLHLAPPAADASPGRDDRTRNLLAALAQGGSVPKRLVYVSTSGVYGHCHGAWIDETCRVNPVTRRAQRRWDAEQQLRVFARRHGTRVSILRAPGIYASDRLPVERLQRQLPVLCAGEDVYTNHVHADDLAAACCLALRRGRANRIYNASDDSALLMGAYFDLVADALGLPRPPRLPRAEIKTVLSPLQYSFFCESRRLLNQRLKKELGLRLRYPQVQTAIVHDRGDVDVVV